MAKLLVVDDNPSVLRLLTSVLSLSHEVHEATTVHTAMQHLVHNAVDLVVLDWMMPVVDGLEALAQIRANERTRGLPVILLTARTEPGAEITCLRAGADAYVSKPFDPDMLEALISTMLAQSEAQRASERLERLALLAGA